MAIRTVSNTGGNWNATTTWVGGVVPSTTLDTVAFTATSGQLTVNVASTCIGIDFTNYVNTITFTALLTINGPVNLGTGGYTQAGASGITAGATATHTSGGVTWSRLWTFAGTSQTHTLSGTWTFTGTLNFSPTTAMTLTGSTINTANLTVTTTATVSGTTAIVFNGTGTWNHTVTGVIRNNVTINTAGTLTIGTNIYYNTGTLTYTSGTVTTTGSTLNISAATTLNTSGMTWNNITFGATQTITSNLNIGGNLVTTVSSNPTINGLFNVNVGGNFTVNSIFSGTSTIILNGTGTWSHASTITLSNNLIINTTGTITISGTVYYGIGTITYTSGTVISTGSTLNITSGIISTGTMSWENILFATNGSFTMAIGSNLYLNGTFTIGGAGTVNGVFNIYCGNFTINNSTSGAASVIVTMPQTIYVYNTLTFGFSSSGTGSFGATFYVYRNLTLGNGGSNTGTSQVIMVGTGSITGTNTFNHPLTFNSSGVITIPVSLSINAVNLIYTNGIIKANTATLFCGNTTTPQTLTNIHKIAWKAVNITSNSTLLMNEFFSGSPGVTTTITPSSTTNYTITFQDRFEKFSKFVKVSRATLSNPGQLTVTTNKGNQLNNIGIKFAPNQIANGLAKNTPSTPSTSPFGIQPSLLMTDPTLS